MDPAYVSRALRQADGKRPSLELMRRIAAALGLSPSVFPEYRERIVLEAVRERPALRDRVFAEIDKPPDG